MIAHVYLETEFIYLRYLYCACAEGGGGAAHALQDGCCSMDSPVFLRLLSRSLAPGAVPA